MTNRSFKKYNTKKIAKHSLSRQEEKSCLKWITYTLIPNSSINDHLGRFRLLAFFSKDQFIDGFNAILKHPDIDINFQNPGDKSSILFVAISNHFHEGTKTLLEHPKIDTDLTDIHGNTVVHRAVVVNDPVCLDMLIKKHCRIDVPDNMGRLPLHIAVFAKCVQCLELLLKEQERLKKSNESHLNTLEAQSHIDNRTPIEDAVAVGNVEIIEILLEAYYKWVPDQSRRLEATRRLLHIAVHWNRLDCLKFLIKFGLDVNQSFTSDDPTDTPIYRAVQQRKLEMVEYLRSVNANPCLPNGQNPSLMYACSHDFAEMIPFLFTQDTSRDCLLQIAGLGIYKRTFDSLKKFI